VKLQTVDGEFGGVVLGIDRQLQFLTLRDGKYHHMCDW